MATLTTRRSLAAAAVVLAATVAGPARAADEVVAYSCVEPPGQAHESTWKIVVTTPKYADLGAMINIETTLSPTRPAPFTLPERGITGTMTLAVNGPLSFETVVRGLTNPAPVPPGAQFTLSSGRGSTRLERNGKYLFTPIAFDLTTWMGTELHCRPATTAPVAGTTKVTGIEPSTPPNP